VGGMRAGPFFHLKLAALLVQGWRVPAPIGENSRWSSGVKPPATWRLRKTNQDRELAPAMSTVALGDTLHDQSCARCGVHSEAQRSQQDHIQESKTQPPE